jgi:CubicO group peptidase (beta-lactamase class C family)
MSSALDCNDDVEESPGNEENMYPKQVWARWAADIPVKADYIRDVSGRGPFSYCTAGVFLLGQMLRRAAGQDVDDYLDAKLFGPMGIANREWPKSPSGEIMTGGGLRLRSRDLAKLGQMILDGGTWEGRQIVPAKWIADALTVHRNARPGQDYGYLFWRRDYATACGRSSGWFMSGNGGNAIVMVPDLHAVVVVTRVNYNSKGMHQQTIQILEDYVFRSLACAR